MTRLRHLSDAEAALIQRAALHGEGCLPISPYWNPTTVAVAVARLTAIGIFVERPAKTARPIWRQDEHLGEISLVLTARGRALAAEIPFEPDPSCDPLALERG